MSRPDRSDRWIQRPRPVPDARLRLFCLPHAGGGATTFRGWADALPEDVDVCLVQLPGRENRIREPPFDAWEPLVHAMADAIEPLLDTPYAVFGHSTGAMLGFELARTLRAGGRPEPVHLFASGRPAPHLPRTSRTTYHLPDDEIIRELRALGGVPDEVLEHRELMEFLLPLLRADLAVNERYAFPGGDPLDAPITGYAGQDDPRAPPGEMEAWREQTRGRFRLRVFPGGHFYFRTGLAAVLRCLSEDLGAPQAGT
jgi:medium-chain acyl-[acyl-carrier-protein] hydrolase